MDLEFGIENGWWRGGDCYDQFLQGGFFLVLFLTSILFEILGNPKISNKTGSKKKQ